MPTSVSAALTAVFLALCLVGSVHALRCWHTRSEWRWEALSASVTFACLAAWTYLTRGEGGDRVSPGAWVAFGAAMLAIGWTAGAARARWVRKRRGPEASSEPRGN